MFVCACESRYVKCIIPQNWTPIRGQCWAPIDTKAARFTIVSNSSPRSLRKQLSRHEFWSISGAPPDALAAYNQ